MPRQQHGMSTALPPEAEAWPADHMVVLPPLRHCKLWHHQHRQGGCQACAQGHTIKRRCWLLGMQTLLPLIYLYCQGLRPATAAASAGGTTLASLPPAGAPMKAYTGCAKALLLTAIGPQPHLLHDLLQRDKVPHIHIWLVWGYVIGWVQVD